MASRRYGIAHTPRHHEIDRPADGCRERIAQRQEIVKPRTIGGVERDFEIDIGALWVEVFLARRRAEIRRAAARRIGGTVRQSASDALQSAAAWPSLF